MKFVKFGDVAVGDNFRHNGDTWVKLDDHSASNPGRGHTCYFHQDDLVGDYQSWLSS